jgi:ankyrin repeat protein
MMRHEGIMHRFMLNLGIGMSLIAATACRANVRELTPLMRAAREGDLDDMRSLLDAGADPMDRDMRNGWTALFHAIHTRQVDAVRLLLDRGVSPNRPARLLTPLAMAAADRDPTIVQLLLAHGADVHARGLGGATALSVAVSGGALMDIDRPLFGGCHAATVRALLEHDPTLRLPDSIAGTEALWWARFHGCADVLKMVEAGARG